MKPKCLLCGCLTLKLIKQIKTSDIVKIYARLFKIDISHYFSRYEFAEYYQCDECNLLFFSPVFPVDELLYDHMQQFEWYYSKNKYEFEFAREFIKSDDAVLEVGCGKGWFAKHVGLGNFTGLELNNKAQTYAVQDGATVFVQRIEDHAIGLENKYDVVCSFQVLEHVENPESFVNSCISCLKPGGILIISVPSEDSYLNIVEDGILNMPPHHITRWTDNTLIWMANRFDLEIISLKHEQLSDVHVHGYATELIRAVIKRMLHLNHEIVSTSVSHRFLTLICQILGKYYSQILLNDALRPVGEAVMLVCRKSFRA